VSLEAARKVPIYFQADVAQQDVIFSSSLLERVCFHCVRTFQWYDKWLAGKNVFYITCLYVKWHI